ncbi:MAG TPA: CehA/McbA family metallohydrolase, partial [Steroidobacteraceae bacterium]
WNEESGRVRTYVHLDGTPDARHFVAALKSGNSYVTHGPLIFPAVMFGTEIHSAPPGAPLTLGYELAAVAGLKQAQLVSEGTTLSTRTFSDAPRETHVDFVVQPPPHNSWYALSVEDQQGRRAYTNPLWVRSPQ